MKSTLCWSWVLQDPSPGTQWKYKWSASTTIFSHAFLTHRLVGCMYVLSRLYRGEVSEWKKKSLNNEWGLVPWRKLPQDTIHSFRVPVRWLYGRTLVSVILKFGHLIWHWGWNPYERSPLDVCVVPDVFSASSCTAGNSLSKWPQALPAQWRRWWSTERLPENYKDYVTL